MTPRTRCETHAFTLVELLVVMSVIALLVAILLPALAGARKRAQQASCLTQSRQISLGMFQYINDHGDKLFPALMAMSMSDAPTWLRMVGGLGYLGDRNCWKFNTASRILRCPTASMVYSDGTSDPHRGNYGVNDLVFQEYNLVSTPQKTPAMFKISDVRKPSIKYMVFDSSLYRLNYYYTYNPTPGATETAASYYLPGATQNVGKNWTANYINDALYGRHPGPTVNMIYFDGHGASLHVNTIIDPLLLPVPDRKAWFAHQ